MKKRTMLCVLSMVLLITLFTGMVMPISAATAITLSVDNVEAHRGDTVTVDVTLNGETAAAQITLKYNSAVLTPEKIERGPQCPSGWMVETSKDLTKGHFIAFAGTKNETVNGVVARYTYKVNPNAPLGKSSLEVTTANMSDAGTDFVATVSSHGSVTVLSSDPDPVFPFTDVIDSDWYYGDVYYMWENKLMNGTESTLFSPNISLTRGTVVTVLYRMESEPGVSSSDKPFQDVENGLWYTDAIKWAADKEIVLGYGDGNFGPEDKITREQMATILYRFEQYTKETPPDTVEEIAFTDADDVSEYAKGSVNALVKQGIINGRTDNSFDPKGNATRAEYSAVLHRYLVAIGD